MKGWVCVDLAAKGRFLEEIRALLTGEFFQLFEYGGIFRNLAL